MGAWGTSLYSNDTACDLRGDYLDRLKRGKTNEEITQELIEEKSGIMGDVEEEPLFWFALADTQWNYGRLLPEVKEKAMYFLAQEDELERWKDSGEKQLLAWMKTRDKLREKLETPQPPEKKISKYKLYQCKWQLGDVYAYKLSSEYSEEEGFRGKYFAFRKVSEYTWWPGHIVPIIQMYKWIGDELPTLELLAGQRLLPIKAFLHLLDNNGGTADKSKVYNIVLVKESERSIPKNSLFYVGNISGNDLLPLHEGYKGYFAVGWESSKYNNKIEHFFIKMYQASCSAEK